MRILILGGYGIFGGRLARLLADVSELELIIAGRTLAKAEQFCAAYPGPAKVTPLALDRAQVAAYLAETQIDLLVDASGPFQDYGEAPYGVIEACIEAGVPYMDFADAADFVFGVSAYEEAARAKGIFVLSGVSSFPVLTAAVLRQFAKRMRLTHVEGGIAPSPYAGIGLNVMRAVVGYAGSPIKLTRAGQPASARGLAESRRFTIAPPGFEPLRDIHFSLVDVPDLQVLPPEYPGLQDIWMGAGPVPEFLHRMLNLLAKARARLRLPSLAPLSPLFYWVLNRLRFGEHRGGMYVAVKGLREWQEVQESWHLLAEGNDGPFIPSMAIEALVRKMLAGKTPAPGARPAIHELELSDYNHLFEGRDIHTGFRRGATDATAYQAVLEDRFTELPAPLQKFHGPNAPRTWSGEASVREGRNPIAKLIRRLFGFPAPRKQVPLTFELDRQGAREIWTRHFGSQRLRSGRALGKGRNKHLIIEWFGPVRVALAVTLEGDRGHLVSRKWWFLGVPMPRALRPTGDSFEKEIDGRFAFDVEVRAPLIGLIAGYRGTLQPAED